MDDIIARLDRIEARLTSPPANPEFLTVDAAASYASLSPDSIRRLISAGKLQAYRPISGRVLVQRSELDRLVRSATGPVRHGRGIRRGGAA